MNKPKTSRSFILQHRTSPISQIDYKNDSASDAEDQNSLFDDHRVPHFGGQPEEDSPSFDEFDNNADDMESEEDEADLLSELRQLSRNMTKGVSSQKKKQGQGTYDDLSDDLSQPKTSVKEFDEYYQRTFKRFLTKKESDLEKLRKQKEETEAMGLQNKPNLVAKQQKRKHIPIADRVEIIQAKKERDLMKLKKQKEERLEKEMSELTFAPKINHGYIADHVVVKRKEEIPFNKKYQSNKEVSNSHEVNERANMKGKMNKNIVGVMKNSIEKNEKEIVQKLYANTNAQPSHPAPANKPKKQELAVQQTTGVSIQSNRASHKTARSITEPEPVENIQQLSKQIFQEPMRTERASPERPKTIQNKVQRELSGSPSKSIDSRGYHSQERPERTSHSFHEQERHTVEISNDFIRESPQKHTTPEMLENLLKHYAEQRTQGNQSERQNRQVKPAIVDNDRNSLTERTPTKSDRREIIEKESPPRELLSSERSNSGRKIFALSPRSQPNDVIREEVAEEQEENEIASIKQNLMSIQDNIQTLKQSFKTFQEAQSTPKMEHKAPETPRKSKPVQANITQQVSQQGTDKKASPQKANNNQIQPTTHLKREEVRSKTPPPSTVTAAVMKKSSPGGDNRSKQVSPSPAMKAKNSQIIKLAPETGGYAKRAVRPVQETQQTSKLEEKKQNGYSSVGERIVVEVENPSFGNVSFAATGRVNGESERKAAEEDKKTLAREDGFRREQQHVGLEGNLMLKAKTGDNTQSLKDIAQMTLMKFKGLGQKTGVAGEGYAAGYASLRKNK